MILYNFLKERYFRKLFQIHHIRYILKRGIHFQTKLYWVVESIRGITNKKGTTDEDTAAIMTSYHDSYPNCELSNIKSWRMQSANFWRGKWKSKRCSRNEIICICHCEDWTGLHNTMFTAYDLLIFIFVYGTSAFLTCNNPINKFGWMDLNIFPSMVIVWKSPNTHEWCPSFPLMDFTDFTLIIKSLVRLISWILHISH